MQDIYHTQETDVMIFHKSSKSKTTKEEIPTFHEGIITKTNENDVLLGHGNRINSHPGNAQFREIAYNYRALYLGKEINKADKNRIANEIIRNNRNMSPSGRFLRPERSENSSRDNSINSSNEWVEIDEKKVRRKIGRAIRDHHHHDGVNATKPILLRKKVDKCTENSHQTKSEEVEVDEVKEIVIEGGTLAFTTDKAAVVLLEISTDRSSRRKRFYALRNEPSFYENEIIS